MFDNVALDVSIGLIFIFLLYSLLAATISEFIAVIFAYRARMLERGIEQMLDGKNYSYYWWDKLGNFFFWMFYTFSGREEAGALFSKGTSPMRGMKRVTLNKKAALFAANITEHPLYRRSADNSNGSISKKPAYLGPVVFADILIDVLKNKSIESGHQPADNPLLLKNLSATIASTRLDESGNLNKVLSIYIEQANGNTEHFRKLVENWYDNTMQRVAGWYKRQAGRILFIIGIVLAVTFNVNTLEIVTKLSEDDKLRAAMVKSASAYIDEQNKKEVQQNPAVATPVAQKADSAVIAQEKDTDREKDSLDKVVIKKIGEIKKQYAYISDTTNVMMGLGWGDFGGETEWYGKVWHVWKKTYPSPRRWIGFLLTALAISLGAPFWFDLLNKLVKLRGSGARPEQASVAANTTAANVHNKPLPGSKG